MEIKNTNTNDVLRILIDSGANKNILRPGILKRSEQIKPVQVRNFYGTQTVSSKGKAKLLGPDMPPIDVYELKFHDFFDGLLGTESLSQQNAIINYKDSTLSFGNFAVKFKKFYILPKDDYFNHFITVDTDKDGDWLVTEPVQFHNNIIIESGIYKSINNKSTILLKTLSSQPPQLPEGKFYLKVNNFETISPIPVNSVNELDENTIRKLIRTDHLSKMEEENLIKVILENQQVLLKTNEKLTATSAIKHKIITKDEEPVYTKSYRYPHAFKNEVEEQIEEMLRNRIIKHSTSPYSSPIWVVPKKQDASGKKKLRLVIDYRKLNEKTVNDKFPIPQIEEILDSLGKSEYFTTLDLKAGFHQIELDSKDQQKTAFSSSKGHFEFTRMPFGLKNAPATFQRAMNHILREYIGNICYVYMDDIIITGFNLKQHLDNLSKILERLASYNLKIQLDKCEFLKKHTEFLGHIITPDGVKPNPDKINKILEWKIPRNQKEIKQFLGLTGYYRRFIKDYAKLTKPLTKYLKKDSTIDMHDKEYIKSFNDLKQIISSDQILAYPDFKTPFILTTDASNHALGAVLSQIQQNKERPIAFGSRTLNKTEANYSTTEKEALAIMWAVEKYKPYLYGTKFTLVTDHKPLTFIKNSTKNAKILNWRLQLENYDYDVIYKCGKANVVADALSRPPVEVYHNEQDNNDSLLTGNLGSSSIQGNQGQSQNDDSDADTIHSANDSNDYYIHFSNRPLNHYRNQLIFRIANFSTIASETPFTNFHRTTIIQPNFNETEITEFIKRYHNGKQTALLAPENLIQLIQNSFKRHFSAKGHFVFCTCIVEDVANEDRQSAIITKEHNRAHRGITEVETQIKRSYFFPKMNAQIKNFINSCEICNVHKYDRKPYNIKISPRPITDRPLKRVHMDIFIIDKCNFLSLIDSFSKHLQMYHIKTKNVVHVQKAVSKYFSVFGTPELIVTDHETTFTSIQFKNFLGELGVSIEYASSSESNGQIERTHSTIIEIFNTNKNKFRGMKTQSIVKLAVALYNDTIHSSTKFTPNEIIFNRNNVTNPEVILGNAQKIFLETIQNLEKSQQNQTKLNSRKETPPQISENQEVFLKPNIRTKTQPRGNKANAHNVTDRTFLNRNNIKRNKNKIKRTKKVNY